MANAEKFVPFIIRFEAGVNPAGLEGKELFEKARATGFADDPDDLGGATMTGVTLATYETYCRRKGYPRPTASGLRAITYECWLDIFKTMYWDRWHADGIASQPVAEILVDWVWASGSYGIKIPQRLLGVSADGIAGPKTLAAVNAREPEELFDAVKRERKAFIDEICAKRPANNKFRKGWLRRIDAIKFER